MRELGCDRDIAAQHLRVVTDLRGQLRKSPALVSPKHSCDKKIIETWRYTSDDIEKLIMADLGFEDGPSMGSVDLIWERPPSEVTVRHTYTENES